MQLLKLRYLQIKRDLSYWVVILSALAFFISSAIAERSSYYATGLTAAICMLVYTYHLNRKDLNFVFKYLDDPKLNICINYNLLVLPVSAGLLANYYWLNALALHMFVSLIVFTTFKTRSPELHFIKNYLPTTQFEWIAGLRKNFYLLILLSVSVLFFSPVKFFGAVSLLLFHSVFLSFYNFFEPLVMFNPEGLDAATFLKKKTAFFHKVIFIIEAPLLLLNSIFHPDIAWFNACLLVGFFLLASCTIYLKYANYRPNQSQAFHIDSFLLYFSAIIPFLLPLAYILTLSAKKKAIQHLSLYTHDQR